MPVIYDWDQKDFQTLIENCPDAPVTPFIFKYMPKDGQILEAGCGSGRFVHYLKNLGYQIVGIEINQKTVDVLNKTYPQLDIVQGDVRKLPFPDESMAGILSLGVIEHIIEGLEGSIEEMYRVLQKGKCALIIVPSFNYIRKIKYALGIYHLMGLLRYSKLMRKIFRKLPIKIDENTKKILAKSKLKHWNILGDFIEYRLTKKQFEMQLEKAGFKIVETVPTSLIDGIYHEFGGVFVKIANHNFYPNFAGRWLNRILSKIPFCSNHMQLCVVKK